MWYLSPDLIIFLFSIYLLIINIKFSVITYLDQNQWSLVVTVDMVVVLAVVRWAVISFLPADHLAPKPGAGQQVLWADWDIKIEILRLYLSISWATPAAIYL